MGARYSFGNAIVQPRRQAWRRQALSGLCDSYGKPGREKPMAELRSSTTLLRRQPPLGTGSADITPKKKKKQIDNIMDAFKFAKI